MPRAASFWSNRDHEATGGDAATETMKSSQTAVLSGAGQRRAGLD